MIRNIGKFLKNTFPFLSVLVLWHLSVQFWNPAGILALIPIFYYSFIKPTDWFTLYAVIFCFLIDYKFDTLLFWTSFYCLFNAVNGFQSFVDLTKQKSEGVMVFMAYFATSSLILVLADWSFIIMVRAFWLVLWSSVLYVPFVALAKRINND
ncbi:MAG: hypothetical protein JW974_03765 [Alphaproteobacteria bacterium]|nr:hypothetical protein [Alphaproteobacteria bacterium]MBN2675353.1 hypothetical protein [Alphaproteobacteria bacterium]